LDDQNYSAEKERPRDTDDAIPVPTRVNSSGEQCAGQDVKNQTGADTIQ